MKIVLYESNEPLREGERWIALLTEEQFITIDGNPTGETKTVFLPVYFFGSGSGVAHDRAMAFWQGEKAKKQ